MALSGSAWRMTWQKELSVWGFSSPSSPVLANLSGPVSTLAQSCSVMQPL